MSTTIGPPGPCYDNTLLGRCMRAYDEAPNWGIAHPKGFAHPNGIAMVLEHLAAEVMAQQHMRGSMDAHEVARMLLEGASSQRVTPLHPPQPLSPPAQVATSLTATRSAMAETIHASTHDINDGPTWHVERQPEGTTDPQLVSFVKRGRQGKLLDQVARWVPDGWDTKRWVPRPPQVPRWLLQKVEGHMRRCIDA